MTPAQASAAAAASWSPSDISAAEQAQINSSADPTLAAYYANLTGENTAEFDAQASTQAFGTAQSAFNGGKGVSPNAANYANTAGVNANTMFTGPGNNTGANYNFGKDLGAINTTSADLASGNYAGAITAAENGTNFNGSAQSFSQDNMIMQQLLTNPALLDPSKKWDQASDTAFAQAMFASDPSKLGTSTSGQWGNASSAAGDMAAWVKANGNEAPDLNASLGARPSQGNFMDKATPYIDAVEIGVMTGGLGAALTPAIGAVGAGAVAGGVGAAASDAANNQSLTLGSVGKGALMGAAGGVAQGPAGDYLGGGIQSATGLGGTASSIVGNGLVQGAVGAGTGALLGGANGAVMGGLRGLGSGITSTSSNAADISGSVPGAVANVGSKYITGAVGSALTGGNGQVNNGNSTVTANTGIPNSLGNIGGGLTAPTNYGIKPGYTDPATGMTYPPTYITTPPGSGAPVTNSGGAITTDTGLASTIGSLIPAAAGAYGAQNAAEAQTNADNNAISTQTNTLGNINNVWATQQKLGQGADTALGATLGTNGQPADYSGFENMPGYQFAVSQGTQAIQRQAASMGSAYTPNTSEAVGQYVTGTAMSDYNTYVGQLMGAAGLGSTANSGLQTANQTVGNNISTLQQNQGQAQAAGITGVAGDVGGAFSPNGAGTSLIGAASRFLNGGAGGSPSGGGGAPGTGGYSGDTSIDPSTGQPYLYDGSTGSGSELSPGLTDGAGNIDPSSFTYDQPSMPDVDTGSMGDDFSNSSIFDGSGYF
jgi:hypothetical protein